MTICEYFFNQYINLHTEEQKGAKKYYLQKIGEKYDKGSYEYVERIFTYCLGGAWDYNFKNAGITYEQYKKANENKFLGHKYFSNWEAQKLHQTDSYWLTKKGIKAMYKAFKGKW